MMTADRTAGVAVGNVGDPLSSLCVTVQGVGEHHRSEMIGLLRGILNFESSNLTRKLSNISCW